MVDTKYTVYILISRSSKKTYVGYTRDLRKRIAEHNSGSSNFSKKYKPWDILYTEVFNNKGEALRKEKYFKSRVGRRWMKKNLFSNEQFIHAAVVEW